jgi:hypothetical protein
MLKQYLSNSPRMHLECWLGWVSLFLATPTYKFVVLDSTYGRNQDHWHLVASDLDSTADDFERMLATPWIQVVDIDGRTDV